MRLALPSLPVRRPPSRRSRALAAGTKAVKGAGGVARRTRATVAVPFLSVGALLLLLRKRMRTRREGALDATVDAPAATTEPSRPIAEDPRPANPETDLPTPHNGGGSGSKEKTRETAKAAVADVDGPNEGAAGHQPG